MSISERRVIRATSYFLASRGNNGSSRNRATGLLFPIYTVIDYGFSYLIFCSHLVDSYEAHGHAIRLDFNLDFSLTVTLPPEFAPDTDYSFKLHFFKTLQLILRYQHRLFAADHFFSAYLPCIDAQRVAEVVFWHFSLYLGYFSKNSSILEFADSISGNVSKISSE